MDRHAKRLRKEQRGILGEGARFRLFLNKGLGWLIKREVRKTVRRRKGWIEGEEEGEEGNKSRGAGGV